MGIYARMLKEIHDIVNDDIPAEEKVERIAKEVNTLEFPSDMNDPLFEWYMRNQENYRHRRIIKIRQQPFSFTDDTDIMKK